MKKIFPVIGLVLLICGRGPAAGDDQSASGQFKIKAVSLAVKAALKTYLINSDFQSLKNEKTAEINRKTAVQFTADYNRAWPVLKKCPWLVSKYRLRQNAAKHEILRIVGRLTRDDCLEAVENIPDEVVFDQFNNCMNDPEIQNKPLDEQMNLVIKKFIGKGG